MSIILELIIVLLVVQVDILMKVDLAHLVLITMYQMEQHVNVHLVLLELKEIQIM
jgi:hypothetical protein